jgi:subtilisin family serine protease
MNPVYRTFAQAVALAVVAAVLVVEPAAFRQGGTSPQFETVDGALAVPGEVLVKFRQPQPESARRNLDLLLEADRNTQIGRAGVRRIHSRRHDTARLLALLRANPDVEYAEPNSIVQSDAIPVDSFFGELWGLLNLGQRVGTLGTPGADVSASLAWDVSTGSRATVVAIIDTGINYRHPDLAANVWSAPAPFTVTIGGVTITCAAGSHGFNTITNTCNPDDDNGHGSHVSGTIGAVGNNGLGVVGVNWIASMMAVKSLDNMGTGLLSDTIDALEFVMQAAEATGANVRVLSNSYRTTHSLALLDQINRTSSKGMLFVASAGNTGSNNDVAPQYPASYPVPNVISVAATDNRDLLWGGSNYGTATVHLGAPGTNILSTTLFDEYQYSTGTSMAVPHVSGAAALLLSECDLTTPQLKAILLSNVEPIPSLAGKVVTGGRLDVDQALRSCVFADFEMTAAPAAPTGTTASSYTVTVTPSGSFTGTVTFSASGVPDGAAAVFLPPSVTSSGSTVMTVTPGLGTPRGSVPLTITGTSASLVHTAIVTFTNDHAPSAATDVVTTLEDTRAEIAVLANDADLDGDSLTVAVAGEPLHGSATANLDGTIAYLPAANYNGADTFTYTIDDGRGGIATGAVQVTITEVNDAPVAADLTMSTDEDVARATALSGTDVESSALTYTIVAQPAHGTLTGTAPAISYAPAANFSGQDTFTFKVSDGAADSNVATVSIVVNEINDAPVVADQAIAVDEDTAGAVALAGTDVEQSPLTYTIVAGPARGVLSGTAPFLTYTPGANYNGSDSFTFRASDGSADSNVASVTISIAAVNDAPVAAGLAISTDEDVALAIVLSGTDVEGSTLSYTIIAQPAHGTLIGTAPAISYRPAANFSGPDTFTFKVTDGAADSSVASVSIGVNEINDAPVAADKAIAVDEDTAGVIGLVGTDVEQSPLTYTIVAGPARGVLSGTAPFLTYMPGANYNGSDSFTFKVSDGSADSNVASVTISIAEVNDAPTAADQTVTTDEDAPAAIALGAADAEGGAVTYTIVVPPAHGTLSGIAPALTYTPAANYNGVDAFAFKVSDGLVDSNLATVSIGVSGINDPPVAAHQTLTIDEDAGTAIALGATDAEGAALTYTIVIPPAYGTLSGIAPALTYTPAANYNGFDVFVFKVSDGLVDSTLTLISICVTGVNDAPVAGDQMVTTDEDAAKAITLAATDPESAALTYTIVAAPAHGMLSGLAPALTYTPSVNYNGADSFTFKVSDGLVDSNLATVSISVTGVNDAPVGADQAVTTDEDAAKAITLAATDTESAALTYTIVAAPAHGMLSGLAPALTYTPAVNYSGADSFTFKVSDGLVDSNLATVSINVSGVNDAPVAANQAVTTDEDGATAIALGATDTESAALVYTIVAGPAHGTLSGLAPALIYSPAVNYSGADSFTFKVSDGLVDSNLATVSISVSGVNDAPVAANQAVTTGEDADTAVTLGATDTENAALSYTIVAAPAHGTLSGLAPALIYSPAVNYSGTDSFTFKVSDGVVDSNLATVSISVTGVNDAPVAADQMVMTAEDAAAAIALGAADSEGTALIYAIVAQPAHGTLSGLAPALTYAPAANYSGPDSFTFKVSDGLVDSNLATVSISVSDINDAPVAGDQLVAIDEDAATAIALGATDTETAALTYTIVAAPAHGTLSGVAPALTYTPAANYSGPDSFTFKVNDGVVDSNLATVSISVTGVNDAPIAANQTVTTDEDAATAISLGATDTESAALTYTIVVPPVHGTLSGVAPALTYTPAANYSGPDSFTFKVSDGLVDSNLATVSISVTGVDDAPVAVDQMVTTGEDAARAIALGATDAEGAALSYTLVIPPAHGTLSGLVPELTYTPAPNYSGPDSFTFKVSDGSADSYFATVSISVTAVNDAPSFVSGADQTVLANSGMKTIGGWASAISAGAPDESGQSLNFILNNDNPALFLVQPAIDANGTLTFTPAAGATGMARVTARLHDNGGTAEGGLDTSVARTFTVSVTLPVKPSLSIGDASVAEGNTGTKPMVFSVTLSAASAVPVTVNYNTLNGTASSRDYQSTSGTLTFAPGETTRGISVMVSGDNSKESSETFVLRFSAAVGAILTKSEALGVILDDDSM